MTHLVPTVIRLPEDDLKRYKAVAEEEGISFAKLVRESLRKVTAIPVHAAPGQKKKFLFNPEPYRKWSSGSKHGARDHDKYIYRRDW